MAKAKKPSAKKIRKPARTSNASKKQTLDRARENLEGIEPTGSYTPAVPGIEYKGHAVSFPLTNMAFEEGVNKLLEAIDIAVAGSFYVIGQNAGPYGYRSYWVGGYPFAGGWAVNGTRSGEADYDDLMLHQAIRFTRREDAFRCISTLKAGWEASGGTWSEDTDVRKVTLKEVQASENLWAKRYPTAARLRAI